MRSKGRAQLAYPSCILPKPELTVTYLTIPNHFLIQSTQAKNTGTCLLVPHPMPQARTSTARGEVPPRNPISQHDQSSVHSPPSDVHQRRATAPKRSRSTHRTIQSQSLDHSPLWASQKLKVPGTSKGDRRILRQYLASQGLSGCHPHSGKKTWL